MAALRSLPTRRDCEGEQKPKSSRLDDSDYSNISVNVEMSTTTTAFKVMAQSKTFEAAIPGKAAWSHGRDGSPRL